MPERYKYRQPVLADDDVFYINGVTDLKTLIVVSHPNLTHSVVNKRWIEELKKYPDLYTVHDLYQAYPDGVIDVAKEQALVEQHGNLILQFPLYWFNCPPRLKQWLDEVFLYGWAYGSTSGYKLKSHKIALAVSAGISQEDFVEGGQYNGSLQQILQPFELTAKYVQADYAEPYLFYDAEFKLSPERVEASAKGYIEYLSVL